MQTLLSRFCEEFVRILSPLLPPLSKSSERIAQASDKEPTKTLQSQLVDLRHQMELLSEKVAAQQAYVLIFGPLKSGKSTLMNAISGSYVSEVSSLPAYPCMVFVSHAPKREFVLTRYNGRNETFESPGELKDKVGEAHAALARRIRETEGRGGQFDPRVHFEDAISKIDVKVPTKELGQSRAVLVDTPGLYSRMKFGYDHMTREFRSTAACAIFVVRSDNLFLDQVFAEFTDLLELFSRIFLIVNVDSSKQDLSPDGKLIPALEQQDPEKIIGAFESLVMSAPLAEALEEGRLQIYPIDLLRAGHERLDPDARSTERTDEKGKVGSADFDRFFGDLTEYLNSSDYVVSFLGDSLRRAKSLLDEIVDLCAQDEVTSLRTRLTDLRQRQRTQEARQQAVERLEGASWTKRFDRLSKELASQCESISADIGARTSRALLDAVQQWYKNRDSLHKLVKKDLNDLLVDYQEDLSAAVSKELSELLVKTGTAITLPDRLSTALKLTGIDLSRICREAHRKTDHGALVSVPPTSLRTDHFQVKRGLTDWLFLRGQNAMRRRLFGPIDNPALPIAPEAKSSRLGEVARAEMKRRIEIYQRGFFSETVERIVDGFTRGFCQLVFEDLTRSLRHRRSTIDAELAKATEQLKVTEGLLTPLNQLQKRADSAVASLQNLTEHYGQVDLFLLTQPVEANYTLPSATPAVDTTVAEAEPEASDHGNGAGVPAETTPPPSADS